MSNIICSAVSWPVLGYIVQIIIILLVLALFIWYYVHISRKNKPKNSEETSLLNSNIKKIDDDTYLIIRNKADDYNLPPDYLQDDDTAPIAKQREDNKIDHFSKQLGDLSKSASEKPKSRKIYFGGAASKDHKEADEVKQNKKSVSTLNRDTNTYSKSRKLIDTLAHEKEDLSGEKNIKKDDDKKSETEAKNAKSSKNSSKND